jgi:hypothetical protein
VAKHAQLAAVQVLVDGRSHDRGKRAELLMKVAGEKRSRRACACCTSVWLRRRPPSLWPPPRRTRCVVLLILMLGECSPVWWVRESARVHGTWLVPVQLAPRYAAVSLLGSGNAPPHTHPRVSHAT